MKKLVIFAGIMAMLSTLGACTSYYYSTLSSSDPGALKNQEGDFVTENDSVLISYSFYGENAPVSITIYNKTDEPLFVDWQRSALIIDDVATSYYQETAPLQGRTEADTYGGTYSWSKRSEQTWGSTGGTFSGEVALPKGVTFIPPRSKVEATPLHLANFDFDKIPKEEYVRMPVAKQNAEVVNVRVRKYTEEESPLRFRSYLTLYTAGKGKDDKKYTAYDHSFYLSELVKAGSMRPDNWKAARQQSGDFFYVRNTKGQEAGITVGVIAIGAAGIVLESALTPASDL